MPTSKTAEPRRGQVKVGWGFGEGATIAEGRTVVELLGGGRRYEVYLVWDERLYALAVAKILRPDLLADESVLRKLRREAELLRRLAHPVLVRGLGATLDGPVPHLLLEHLDGPDVRRLVREQGPLSFEDVVETGEQIACVLHYLSAEEVVHLDVKPSNVVFGPPSRLIDLGAARSLESAARLSAPFGTDAFMAPELCAAGPGGGRVDSAADVWSLGATLYYAATGEVPFPRPAGAKASGDPAVRFPQLVAPPERLPDYVPASLAALIVRMLAADQAERPPAAEVADELAAL